MSTTPLKTQGFTQSIHKQTVDQKEKLGTVRYLEDGRCYAYARAGAVALLSGNMTQSAIPITTANNETLSSVQSAAIGDSSIIVTFAGAVTEDFYKDGWFYFNDEVGEAHTYRIKSHAAGTASVTINLYDNIRVAATASTSQWTAIQNVQNEVLAIATTLTGIPTGVPNIAVTAYYYFWNQVKGPCAVLTNGTVVVGNDVGLHDASGTVGPLGTADIIGSVGRALGVAATTEYALIMLAIPGY